jgi:WD repeat and SOF domain-containing protein 1
MSSRSGRSRLLPLASYTNAVEEKQYLTSHTPSWTTTLFVSVPFRRARHVKLVLPIPQKLWNATSSRLGRRRAAAVLCFMFAFATLIGYALAKRFVDKDKEWPPPFTGKPPTLVFRRTELQRIWEWEIASGHYPSNKSSVSYFLYWLPQLLILDYNSTYSNRAPNSPSES